MEQYLQFFIILPLAGFMLSMVIPRKRETVISWIAISTVGIQVAALLLFAIYWLINNHPVLDVKHVTVYRTTGFEIFVDFYFDKEQKWRTAIEKLRMIVLDCGLVNIGFQGVFYLSDFSNIGEPDLSRSLCICCLLDENTIGII